MCVHGLVQEDGVVVAWTAKRPGKEDGVVVAWTAERPGKASSLISLEDGTVEDGGDRA